MRRQHANSLFNTLNKDKGYTCPCCGQLVKTYRRSFNCNMAICLIALVKHNQYDWVKIEDFLLKHGYQRCGDFSYLVHFDFLEKMAGKREDGSPRNGMYRITPKGIAFVKEEITVPAKFLISNNKLQGFEGEEINIRQALGKKFNFEELMNEA